MLYGLLLLIFAVAPFVGAWIEISHIMVILYNHGWSRPSWARGLKCVNLGYLDIRVGRALRGRVD